VTTQLEHIETDFRTAQARLDVLGKTLSPADWVTRPPEGGWSAVECVAHLNQTADAFIPSLRATIREAADKYERKEQRYRRDPMGWLLSVIMPPPVRLLRVKTSKPFEPPPGLDPERLVARFRELQDQQIALLHEADGMPLSSMWIQSPFDARARYNVYSCFVILPRHQHRHLWQAERAVARLGRRPQTSPSP
jgi:hypothetical protein